MWAELRARLSRWWTRRSGLRRDAVRELARPAEGPAAQEGPGEEAEEFDLDPRAAGPKNLDAQVFAPGPLGARDAAILRAIELRLARDKFELPQLSSTALALMGVLGRPSAEIDEIARLFTGDPALSTQLVRTANSVLHGGKVASTSIRDCVMRVGLRSLRGMILAASMRQTLFNGSIANHFAELAWRQALSVASIARAIARPLREDPDRAFTLGLLHDLGKIPLLSMLAAEAGTRTIDSALVGTLFLRLHERAGRAAAARWELGPELEAVCGDHHRIADDHPFARAAALVSLAHKLDLRLSLGDQVGFRGLVRAEAFDRLEVPEETRHAVLRLAEQAYLESVDLGAAAA
jgi:HD-like signal output (HDOD) protein